MKIIYKPRSSGKTAEIVKWVKEGRKDKPNRRMIIVYSPDQKRALLNTDKLQEQEVETADDVAQLPISTLENTEFFFGRC